MLRTLRVRLVAAFLLAVFSVAVVSQVLPNVSGFGGEAHAAESGGSSS